MIRKNYIYFAAIAQELYDSKELMPEPQKHNLPKWFKNIKSVNSGENFKYISKTKNVKKCPSFSEIWNEGYVIKAPTDYLLKVNEDGTYIWKTAFSYEKYQSVKDVDEHYDIQMIEYYPNKDYVKILKLQLPFRVYTGKGVSCRQIPLLFQDKTNNWEVPYGIVRTDKVHEINIQLMIKNYNEILIKKGTPLCIYVPFKREKFIHKNFYLANKRKFINLDNKNYLKMFGGFKNNTSFYWSD